MEIKNFYLIKGYQKKDFGIGNQYRFKQCIGGDFHLLHFF